MALTTSPALSSLQLSDNGPQHQQETAKVQERLHEVEQLQEELERRDAGLQATEQEKALVKQRLQQTLEEVQSLAREKEALSQLCDSLQAERDQLQDTVSMARVALGSKLITGTVTCHL